MAEVGNQLLEVGILRDLEVDIQPGHQLVVGTPAGQGEVVEILDEQEGNLREEHWADLIVDTFPWQLHSPPHEPLTSSFNKFVFVITLLWSEKLL